MLLPQRLLNNLIPLKIGEVILKIYTLYIIWLHIEVFSIIDNCYKDVIIQNSCC